MDILTHITDTLKAKTQRLQTYFDYYDGTAPIPLVADRLREVYRDLNLHPSENWSGVVVDTAADRITLEGVTLPDTRSQAAMDDVLQRTEFIITADDATQETLIAGETYFIVWTDEDGEIECYLNDPRMCHVEYDSERPNHKKMAYKWWDADDGYRHIKVYTADTISEYRTEMRLTGVVDQRFELLDEFDNPHNIIPVFHLRTNYRRPRSELHRVIPIQDTINILLANMLATSEYAAAPMKYVISNARGFENLKSGPNQVWHIPSSDGIGEGTSVGQFAAADLGNFLTPIEHAINAISGTSRTPHHLFYRAGDFPSGEALKTAERPLVSKCNDYITRFTPVYRRMVQFMLHLKGITTDDIAVQWAPVETLQPLQAAQEEKTIVESKLLKRDAGVSQRQVLRELGYTEEQIDTMEAEQTMTAEDAGTALLAAMNRGQ